MRSKLGTLAACVALGTVAPCAALADSPPVPDPWAPREGASPQEIAVIADLRARADAAADAGDLRAAFTYSFAAYQRTRDRVFACNAGILAEHLAAKGSEDSGTLHELATELLDRCTAAYRLLPPSDPKEQTKATRYLAALELARAALARIRVISPDPSVDVSVGGRPLGRGPIDTVVYVKGGSHILRAQRGAQSTERTLQVEPPKAYTVRLDLPEPATDKDDDHFTPVGAPPQGDLPPPLSPRRDAEPPLLLSHRDPIVIASTAASGGAAVAAALLFSLSATSQSAAEQARKDADSITGLECFQGSRAPVDCRRYGQQSTDAKNYETAAFVSLTGAVAVGLATVAYVLLHPKRAPRTEIIARSRGAGMEVTW